MLNLSTEDKATLCESILHHSQEGIFLLDSKLCYVFINDKYTDILNIDAIHLINRPFGKYASKSLEDHVNHEVLKAHRLLSEGKRYVGVMQVTTRYYTKVNVYFNIKPVILSNETYYIGSVVQKDIDDEMLNAKFDLLKYDPLTQLINRSSFMIQATDLLLDSYLEAVIVRLNIDQFDTLQNSVSKDKINMLLKEFVNKVHAANLEYLKLFSRLNNQEFALFFEADNSKIIYNDLHKLMQISELPYFVDSQTPIYLRFSVGMSQYPKYGSQISVLLDKAEKALAFIQAKGGDDICKFTDSLNDDSIIELRIESEIRDALDNQEFFPVFQPKVDLKTGNIVGFETLVRWKHPIRGVLPPSTFLENVIKHKLSFQMFKQVSDQACQELSRMQEEGHEYHFCINVDAYELLHPEFIGHVKYLIDKYDIQYQRLHIEVTERTLMYKHAEVRKVFSQLKSIGILIALDDFGTGFASISYLQNFPFDYIKIDKTFIDEIDKMALSQTNNTQKHIITAIVSLANALEMDIVVEGIERKSQCDIVQAQDCQYGQGYYFGKPTDIEHIRKMLA